MNSNQPCVTNYCIPAKDCIEHNQKWVNLARKADDIYGYSIAEYKEPFDIKHPEAPILHKLACNCGGSWKRIRKLEDGKKILVDEPVKVFMVWEII